MVGESRHQMSSIGGKWWDSLHSAHPTIASAPRDPSSPAGIGKACRALGGRRRSHCLNLAHLPLVGKDPRRITDGVVKLELRPVVAVDRDEVAPVCLVQLLEGRHAFLRTADRLQRVAGAADLGQALERAGEGDGRFPDRGLRPGGFRPWPLRPRPGLVPLPPPRGPGVSKSSTRAFSLSAARPRTRALFPRPMFCTLQTSPRLTSALPLETPRSPPRPPPKTPPV